MDIRPEEVVAVDTTSTAVEEKAHQMVSMRPAPITRLSDPLIIRLGGSFSQVVAGQLS